MNIEDHKEDLADSTKDEYEMCDGEYGDVDSEYVDHDADVHNDGDGMCHSDTNDIPDGTTDNIENHMDNIVSISEGEGGNTDGSGHTDHIDGSIHDVGDIDQDISNNITDNGDIIDSAEEIIVDSVDEDVKIDYPPAPATYEDAIARHPDIEEQFGAWLTDCIDHGILHIGDNTPNINSLRSGEQFNFEEFRQELSQNFDWNLLVHSPEAHAYYLDIFDMIHRELHMLNYYIESGQSALFPETDYQQYCQEAFHAMHHLFHYIYELQPQVPDPVPDIQDV